ncbi:MAG: hypothetical protein L7F78_22000 [Syntrophales bacterium LBB04]|nr:hypothetical protein [Syntrophales bacterium LBB04]
MTIRYNKYYRDQARGKENCEEGQSGEMGLGQSARIIAEEKIKKNLNSDLKMILSSGYSLSGQTRKILERGCNGFIKKPFNVAELSEKNREVLDKVA